MTKGPINLLPSKPHHTFTENHFLNLVALVACRLSWDHVCKFRELFILSRVKDASSVNKMILNSLGCAVIQWHKSIRWAGSPGSRRCTHWSWYGCKSSSCRVCHSCICDTQMREAVLRVDCHGLLWTISQMFPRVLIGGTTSFQTAQQLS